MTEQKKPESHAAFFIIMACLAVAIAGGGYWWFSSNSLEAEKAATAQANLPTHPPKDVKKTTDAAPVPNENR
jgi:hypothetical protein